jgi:hypothetical protein
VPSLVRDQKAVAERPHDGFGASPLWLALCTAPDEGAEIAELIRVTDMSRATLYRHLSQCARTGQAIQVSRGHWRATNTEDPR